MPKRREFLGLWTAGGLAAWLGGGALAAAQVQTQPKRSVYRCTAPGGGVIFQQSPCLESGEKIEVAPGNVVSGERTASDQQLLRSAEIRAAIERREVIAGMSADEVRQALGPPLAVNTDRGRSGLRQQWVYRYADGSRRNVYLRDGRVDAIQEREAPPGRPRDPAARCPTDLEIRNAEVGINSAILPEAEKARRRAEVAKMRACRER